jgi:hypothetical protein
MKLDTFPGTVNFRRVFADMDRERVLCSEKIGRPNPLRPPKMVEEKCANCGKDFKKYTRGLRKVKRHCSSKCQRARKRKVVDLTGNRV